MDVLKPDFDANGPSHIVFASQVSRDSNTSVSEDLPKRFAVVFGMQLPFKNRFSTKAFTFMTSRYRPPADTVRSAQ